MTDQARFGGRSFGAALIVLIAVALIAIPGCLSWIGASSNDDRSRPDARRDSAALRAPARPLRSDGGLYPDRRPVRAIACFNGSPRHPGMLNDEWGSSDDAHAIAWLRSELERGLEEGYTRFSLTLPGGKDPNQKFFSSSHWATMSARRQRMLARFCQEWLAAHPETTLGLYSGFDIDPTPTTVKFDGHRPPRIGNESDRRSMFARTLPWVEQCGFTEIWWDATSKSNRRGPAMHYGRMMMERGIRIGGEAIPRAGAKSSELDREAIETMPWVGLVVYFDRWDPDWTWEVDPETTELFIAIRPTDPGTDEQLLSAFRRGFIPWVHGRKKDDRVMRLWRQVQREQSRGR